MNIKILILSLLFSLTLPSEVSGQGDEYNWFFKWLFYDYIYPEHHYHDNDDGQYELKIDLKGDWNFSIGDNPEWISPDYDDSSWEKIYAPTDWENEGFNGYDGNAYYRTYFDGSSLNKNQVYFLNLGKIDDVDEAYVNGKLIGRSGCFPPEFKTAYIINRRYYIPSALINYDGNNVIAVRVYDDVLNGGITHGELGIYEAVEGKHLVQNLYGSWQFTTENESNFKEQYYNDDQWADLFVPSYWDNHGYKLYDGIAWYRKNFNLELSLDENKTYFLILGKIDDFDITYLNGQEIGYTNDHLDYGHSRSYNKLRIYKIPSGLLNQNASNVLAVKVTDIGNDGGIYMGPVGIIEEGDLTKTIRK